MVQRFSSNEKFSQEAHKIAALYNFEHHVDKNDKCRIIITKTQKSAVPFVTLNEIKIMDTIEKRQMKKVQIKEELETLTRKLSLIEVVL